MNFDKQTIALTGGTGFVGSHLIPKLLERGFAVKVLTRQNQPKLASGVTVIKGDLAKGTNLDPFLKKADILIHLAARRFPPEEEMFPNNVLAAQNLKLQAAKFPIKQVIMLSTVAVYGQDRQTAFVEEDKCLPNTVYGLTKYQAENIIKLWAVKAGIPLAILRPFNIYGPGGSNGVVYNFCQSLKEKKGLTVFGQGDEKRDFLYIDDVVDAILLALIKKADGIFNIGSDINLSILELVNIFQKVIKQDLTIDLKTDQTSQIKNLEYRIDKAKKILGWRAKTSLAKGLKQTIDWWSSSESTNT